MFSCIDLHSRPRKAGKTKMKFLVALLVVCVLQLSLVTSQQSLSNFASTVADLNDYCDARTSRLEANTRVGPKGSIGKAGPRGLRGHTGPPGPIGSTGPKGEQGRVGEKGVKGLQGLSGTPGIKGQRGSVGLPGPTGSPGVRGSAGPVGPKGLIGNPGARGSKGSAGPQGQIGNPGVMNSTAIEEIVRRIVHSDEVKDMMKKTIYENVPGIGICQGVDVNNSKTRTESGGVFDVFVDDLRRVIEVSCDLDTDGGGWTVFQRRMDGSENFYRGWSSYVNGFGRKDKEFWLGLENLYQMTKNGNYELRVDLEDFNGYRVFAKYGSFRIDSSAQNYKLHVSSYSGNAGDSLDYHNGMEFSTHDEDHDARGNNCAETYKGAWWYNNCHYSNLNSLYHDAAGSGSDGVVWKHWKNSYEYLKFTEMKFRRK